MTNDPIMEVFDVAIVGARVAGATLAARLGDRGYRVLLVDSARLPSSTLSTHFFRGGRAGRVLQELGLVERVLTLGAPRLVCEYRYGAGASEPTIVGPQDPGDLGFSLSVRRAELDWLLVQRALATGNVSVRDSTSVRDLVWRGDRVVGVAGSSPDGDWAVRARCVIGADGRNSTVARFVDASLQAYERGHRGFYYRYFRDLPGPGNGAEFHEGDDERAYVFPSDKGLTCVAVSLPLVLFNWVRTAPELGFAAALRGYAGLRERVFDATEYGPLLGCGPTPNYVRRPFGPGWALVGDAGIHQDPWSGVGIDQAMVHATFLADALDLWLSGARSESAALAEYACRRDADALARYERTVMLSRDLRQQLPVGVPSGSL